MNSAKYIIFDDRVAVVFSATQSHAEIARALNMRPTSAGFCAVDDAGRIAAWGSSFTLGISSDPGDSDHLRRLLKPY
jgi:hypothetical protein